MKNVFPLLGLVFISFILVLVIFGIIFTIIVPINNLFQFKLGNIITGILKTIIAFILGLIWIYTVNRITKFYLDNRLRNNNL